MVSYSVDIVEEVARDHKRQKKHRNHGGRINRIQKSNIAYLIWNNYRVESSDPYEKTKPTTLLNAYSAP